MKINAVSLVAAAMLSVLVTEASAKVYAVTASSSVFQTITAPTLLVIGAQGATSLSVTVPRSGFYQVSFTAMCRVDGTAAAANVDILVDGQMQGISAATDDAFCSSDDTPSIDHASTDTLMLPLILTAGTHQVAVRAKVTSGANAIIENIVVTLSD